MSQLGNAMLMSPQGSKWPTWNGSLNGAAAVFSSSSEFLNKVALLTTNTVINVYQDSANSSFGTAVVGTISGTTITWGTPVVFSSSHAISAPLSVVALSATQAIVCYRDNTDFDRGKAVILDVSGTTITANSILTFTSNSLDYISVTMLTATSALVVWDDYSSVLSRAMVLSVSGSTITANTAFTFMASQNQWCNVSTISSTQVLVVYADSTLYGFAQVLDISGTTVSGNTSYAFTSGANTLSFLGMAQITASTFAVIYKDDGNSGFPYAQMLSVAGTIVTYGSSVQVVATATAGSVTPYSIAKADANNVYINYRNVTDSLAKAVIATVTNNTTLTLNTPVALRNAVCRDFSSCNINANQVMNIFRDTGNANKGTGIVSSTI